jgi:phage terminase large subunit-like protein
VIPRTTIRRALDDPNLLGDVLAGESWQAWRTLLIAAMGEELDDDERARFKQLTGREREPGEPVEEFVGVVGRRGGKSRAISVLATYVAGLCNHPDLVAGERGVVLIIAPDQRQADVVLDYVEANFRGSPILNQVVEARTQRSLKLTNRIDIEVRASEFRRLRGPTYVAVIADESAFWMNENSANPDSEILNAVRGQAPRAPNGEFGERSTKGRG